MSKKPMPLKTRILDMLANPEIYCLENHTITNGSFSSKFWYNVTDLSIRLDIDRDDFGFKNSELYLEFESGGSRVRLNAEWYHKLVTWPKKR